MAVEFVDRRGTSSLKWDRLEKLYGNPDLLSMWVADMDFKCPACVNEALMVYMQTGVYGYADLGGPFKDAFVAWERERHGYEADPSWVRLAPGVVPALYWCVLAMTDPSDAVMVLPPVYHPFFGSGEKLGRRLVQSRLVCRDGAWSMDLADIEAKVEAENVKMLLFCSPHNPVGRVWTRGELEGLLDVCNRHGVVVVCDEIHQDFAMPGHVHIPLGALQSERVVMLTSPSKTFNLAGLKTAVALIPDAALRGRFDAFVERIHVGDCNSLGLVAGTAADKEGAAWLDELTGVVRGNFEYMRDTLLDFEPRLAVSDLEGTYLAFIDFGAYVGAERIEAFFKDECRIALDYGSMFRGGADTWARFNLATSREYVTEATRRIAIALGRRTG